MAAALYFSRRLKSCILRSYLWKSVVLCKRRHNYNSGVCELNLYSGRKWDTRRSLSTTKVGIPEFENKTVKRKLEHRDKDRRIMVVLQKKKGEPVPQLHEQDLLKYFSVYGEITDVRWVRSKKDPGTAKGFGFVSFASVTSFQEAVASRNHTVNDRSVLVLPANRREASLSARAASETTVVPEHQPSVSVEAAPEPVATPNQAASVVASMGAASKSMEVPDWTTSASAKAASKPAATPDQVISVAAFLRTAPKPVVAPKETASASVQAARQTRPGQVASVQEEPLHTASMHAESMQAAEPHDKDAQKASMHIASMHLPSAQTVSAHKASPESPEDQKRKILVTQRQGCKGEMTLKSVHDYFSVFGKIEAVQEKSDLVYITFESTESVERVMMVTNHKINNVMVLVSLAYSNQQRKQLRLEKAMADAKMKENPRNVKIAEREGRKIVIMSPTRFKESISKKTLEKYFSSYGAIEEMFVMESKGYGFVIFKDSSVAEQVLKNQNHKIDDVEIYVKMSLATRQITQNSQEGKKRMVVSNISGETSERDIWEHFSQFGKVAEVVFANRPDGGKRTRSCIVTYDSIDGGVMSVVCEPHQISNQQDALVVEVAEGQLVALPNITRLYVSNVTENVTLEMLRSYFEEFGLIQYLGFTRYHSKEVIPTLQGVAMAFCNESAAEKALNKTVHEINRFKVKVSKATHMFIGQPSDFRSLKILMTNVPANVDELGVEEYLLGHSCRVQSVKFLFPTVCIASLWNLRDVNRLVELASEKGHVIGGNPILLRRFHWVREQEEGLQVNDFEFQENN